MLSIWQRNAQLWKYWLVLSNKPLFPRAWGTVTLKSIWLSLPTMFLYRLGNHRLIIMMLKIRWMLHTPRERKPQLPLGFFTLSTCDAWLIHSPSKGSCTLLLSTLKQKNHYGHLIRSYFRHGIFTFDNIFSWISLGFNHNPMQIVPEGCNCKVAKKHSGHLLTSKDLVVKDLLFLMPSKTTWETRRAADLVVHWKESGV